MQWPVDYNDEGVSLLGAAGHLVSAHTVLSHLTSHLLYETYLITQLSAEEATVRAIR